MAAEQQENDCKPTAEVLKLKGETTAPDAIWCSAIYLCALSPLPSLLTFVLPANTGKKPGKRAAITEPLHLGYLCLRSSSSLWYACSWH